MRVLVLWRRGSHVCRNTIVDHALSFQKYDQKNEYFYFDIWNGRYAEDYAWITAEMFDIVIFHYSCLALRWSERYWKNFLSLMKNIWSNYPCVKVVLPQDDYTYTECIWDFCNAVQADYIFTIIREMDFPIVYPQDKIGKRTIKNVLTGYVDDGFITQIEMLPHSERKYDIVYRARKLSYVFGKHGQLKWELSTLFSKQCQDSVLKTDIGNTLGESGDLNAFLGNSWLEFLASSRTTLGCLGGSGIMGATREFILNVFEYEREHADATFEETKGACFPDMEDCLHGMLSPRVFECAATKTCQILVGRDYHDIFRPDEDYIVLEEDYSNIKEVMEKIGDIRYCEDIAETCYRNIIASGQYTYKLFVEYILSEIVDSVRKKSKNKELSSLISKYCKQNNDRVSMEME